MPWPGDLQLSQLELFVRLAEAGSLSAAARQLNLTPAAASAGLKRLEALARVRLVERSTRSLRLTAEGELLLEHARQALGTLDEARARLHPGEDVLEGEIHVGAPSDLGRHWLSPLLSPFLDRHPGVTLVLHTSDALTDLRRERIDLAVRYGAMPDSALVARPLHATRRVLVASPRYLEQHGAPAHPGELASHRCLALYLAGQAQRDWTFWPDPERRGAPVTVRVRGNRRADDGELVRRWAVEGHGIAYKARLDVRQDLLDGRLVALLPQWHGERFPLQAVLPTGRYVPRRVRALLEELVARSAGLEPEDRLAVASGDRPAAPTG